MTVTNLHNFLRVEESKGETFHLSLCLSWPL